MIVIPLLACLLCAGLAAYALLPLAERFSGLFEQRIIPVTGDEPVPAQTPGLPPTIAPENRAPSTQPPEPAQPGSPNTRDDYRAVITENMTTCVRSFKRVFWLETLAMHQPGAAASDDWRQQSRSAAADFEHDCEVLAQQPEPPRGFEQVDRFLKLAAAEVGPAVDALNAQIDGDTGNMLTPDPMQVSIDHLVNFIEYMQHAEAALSGQDLRKEI